MDVSESLNRGFSLTSESVGQGFEFAKMNWKSVFMYFLVGALAMVVLAGVGALIGAGFAYFTYEQIGWATAAAIGVGIFLLLFVAGMTFGYGPAFGAVQFIYNNKKPGYFESGNLGTGFKWAVVAAAAIMAVMLAFGGAILSLATVPILGFILLFVFYLAFIAGAFIFAIISYYAVYEGAMKGRGPVGAIISSYKLIKGNFWETLVFAIVAWVISYIAGLVASIAYYVVYFMAMFLMIVSPVAGIAMMGVSFLVLILLSLLVQCFVFPMQVLFYKRIIEGRGMPSAKEKAGQASKESKKAPPKKK